jgi:predicted Zn-dependent protease
METHPEYAVSGVMTKASILAMSGQPDQACRLLIQTFGIPLPIKAMGSTAIHAAEGNIPTAPLAAAEYYMKQGNVVAARHLLDEASKEGKSTSSQTEILFLRAALEMSAGKWTDALQQLVSYLRSSGRI